MPQSQTYTMRIVFTPILHAAFGDFLSDTVVRKVLTDFRHAFLRKEDLHPVWLCLVIRVLKYMRLTQLSEEKSFAEDLWD